MLIVVYVGMTVPKGVVISLVAAALLLLIFIWFVYTYWQSGQWQRLMAGNRRPDPIKLATMEEIDAMSGVAFEKCVGQLFQQQGYRVEYTSVSTDYGVDIILVKDRIRTAVQVKHYKRPLSQAPVREVVAGMLVYKCSKAMVVTNSTFTASAQHLAKSNHVKLIDRDELARLVVGAGVATFTVVAPLHPGRRSISR